MGFFSKDIKTFNNLFVRNREEEKATDTKLAALAETSLNSKTA